MTSKEANDATLPVAFEGKGFYWVIFNEDIPVEIGASYTRTQFVFSAPDKAEEFLEQYRLISRSFNGKVEVRQLTIDDARLLAKRRGKNQLAVDYEFDLICLDGVKIVEI